MEAKPNKTDSFVDYVLKRCATDNAFAARMRRADNPDTEYQAYGYLAAFGVNLEKDYERLPYALVGAALARLQTAQDGTASLGRALRSCFEDNDDGEPRLRRLLACTQQDELCRILRPLLSLLAAKSTVPLSHAALLRDVCCFHSQAQPIKVRWAQEYYNTLPATDDSAAPQEA